MSPLNWALLLKPFLAILLFAFLYFSARGLAWVIGKLLPDSRIKRILFDPTSGRTDAAPRPPRSEYRQ